MSFTISHDATFSGVQTVKPKKKVRTSLKNTPWLRREPVVSHPHRGTVRSGRFSSVSITGSNLPLPAPQSTLTIGGQPPNNPTPFWYNLPTLSQLPQTRNLEKFFAINKMGNFDTVETGQFQYLSTGQKPKGRRARRRARRRRRNRATRGLPFGVVKKAGNKKWRGHNLTTKNSCPNNAADCNRPYEVSGWTPIMR